MNIFKKVFARARYSGHSSCLNLAVIAIVLIIVVVNIIVILYFIFS